MPCRRPPVRGRCQKKVNFQELSGRHSHKVCEEAAEFATKVGKERLIDISHSKDATGYCTVIAWYWDENYLQD